MKTALPLLCGLAALAPSAHAAPATVVKTPFGTVGGRPVDLYTLTNRNGVQAKITNYGGILTAWRAPDRRGRMADIVLGYDNVAGYVKETPYFGATIGRYGNRIAGGRFTLDGQTYKLATNNGPNSLHGGTKGFDKVIWQARPIRRGGTVGVDLYYLSRNGEEGYPGNLSTRVIYTLNNANELRIEYSAVTDKATVLNLTHHTYFNLAGQGNGTILNHRMMINADRFTPTDKTAIPTGELRPVRGTPFDFRTAKPIGARINNADQQLKFGTGYDHNFVLNGRPGALKLAARAYEPNSGRVLTVHTTEPGVQLYTGNFLDGKITGKGGKKYIKRSAFCLETQHFPDSPNHPNFPSTVLRPGQTYRQTTIYRVSTR